MFEQDFENMLRKHQDIIGDKKKFSALVKDYFPDNVKNMNLLLMAYNLGLTEEIEKASVVSNTLAFRYVKQLMDDFGLSRANADWIVSVWCVCYGQKLLRKPCDIKIQGSTTGPAIKEDVTSESTSKYGDLFEYRGASPTELRVTGFKGSKKKTIIFQNRAHGQNVVGVFRNAFEGEDIEEIVFTEGFKTIELEAFKDCRRLHQIIFPQSMKSIGCEAFAGCTSLRSVNLPAGLEEIDQGAFSGSGLKTIAIPSSVYYLDDMAFSGCVDIDNIVIPRNIDKITKGMFEGCTNLKKIELSENVTSIGERAFYGCKELAFIVIPDSVKFIGEDAFTGTNRQFIIQCSMGSYAEEYCRKNKIKYQLV